MSSSHPSKRPQVGLRTDTRGLVLGTVGDRTKARYLRVYDKGVESKVMESGRMWRLELEAKRTLAPALWTDLQKATDVREWCYNSLAEQWRRSGCAWPLTGSTRGGAGIAVPTAAPTDAVRLARWVKQSVAPAIERLRRAHSASEILSMMGLEGHHDDAPEDANGGKPTGYDRAPHADMAHNVHLAG